MYAVALSTSLVTTRILDLCYRQVGHVSCPNTLIGDNRALLPTIASFSTISNLHCASSLSFCSATLTRAWSEDTKDIVLVCVGNVVVPEKFFITEKKNGSDGNIFGWMEILG